jgi:hypothetical protein
MATAAPELPVVDVPLMLFGGTDSELAPPDCPEGVSPDNQEVMFLPGEVFSRWGLHGVLLSPTGHPILYTKSYKQPNNQVLTLFLDSTGTLYVEPVSTSPGTSSSLFEVTPGLYAQSVSAFGREYIAFSDLLHGQGIPLQYDGTFLDRVTMDGPGAPPAVADAQSAVAIATTGLDTNDTGYLNAITAATEAGNICTLTFAAPSTQPIIPGQPFIVFGAPAGYNGIFTVLAVAAGGLSLTYFNQTTGLSPGSGGFVNLPAALCSTSAPHGLTNGDFCVIKGASPASGGFNPNNAEPALAFSGTVDTDATGFIVSVVSGDVFTDGLIQQNITVNGVETTIETVTSPTSATVSTQLTANQSGVAYTASILNPVNWQVIEVIDAQNFLFSVANSPQLITASGNATGGTLNPGGQSSVGVHQMVVMWLTRQGFISKPSPAGQFISVGNSKWTATALPIGPANVVARVLGFTGAGGDNFFIIPASVNLPNPSGLLAAPVVIQSTVVPDNTSTSFTFDVPDNSLFAAVPIDQIGNDLFDQAVLGPVLGFFAYESRLACWGDYNKIENFLNLGFCGGYLSGALTAPLGWNSAGNLGGTLVNGGPWASGQIWQITGDGSSNKKGLLTQPADLDSFGDPIISPNTSYQFRLWAKASALNLPGDIVLSLSSVSTGFSSTATIPINSLGTAGGFTSLVAFTLETPSTIPDDLLLSLYVINLSNAATVTLGENEIIFVEDPFRDNLSRWSYVENPEAFALTTGNLGPEDDPGPIRCFSLQRNNSILKTASGVHEFSSNDSEPDDWTVNQITRSVGAMSLRGGDPGQFGSGDAAEDWDVSADPKGLYLFAGGDHWKISQEYQTWWDQINQAAQQTVWVKNDPHNRRIYVGVPLGAAVTPNLILVMDYRELDTAVQISGAPPLHITLTGIMKSSDLTRKWTRWNLAMNTGEILMRPNNATEFCLGGTFGNFYFLDPAKLTDDDYGAIGGANSDGLYYITYGFVNHDQEQQLQLGTGRKLLKRMTMYVTGVGLLYFTPLVDSLNNPLPPSSFRQLSADADQGTAQPYDLMWTTGVHGERIFFMVQVAPLPGSTDVQFRLQKLVPGLMVDPIAPRRQMAL